MKDVYALCECGSGKKYKWCCKGKEPKRGMADGDPVAKEPRKPNRAERRKISAVTAKMNRENGKKSILRKKRYTELQKWLANAPSELSKEHADEIFKNVLKKLFKKDYVSDSEFQKAITSSMNSVINVPAIEQKTEEQQVNDQGV